MIIEVHVALKSIWLLKINWPSKLLLMTKMCSLVSYMDPHTISGSIVSDQGSFDRKIGKSSFSSMILGAYLLDSPFYYCFRWVPLNVSGS